MDRVRKSILPLCLAVMMCTTSVFAANVHFKGGKSGGVKSTDLGLVLQACASIAGLGNGDVTIHISAVGLASASCVNPGDNTAPGQNKVPITATATETISADEIKNGTVSVCLTTDSPGPLDPVAAGCPNGNWSAPVADVEFSSVTVTVVQFGQVVLEKTFFL